MSGDDIVIAVYGTAVDWHALRPHPLNYFSVGAMGLAASHGLGLALGRPDKRVIVLDGDGSLTMALGTLITVAGAAPKNFVHILWENGVYQANGGHPLPARGMTDYAGIALAAGYRSGASLRRRGEFRAADRRHPCRRRPGLRRSEDRARAVEEARLTSRCGSRRCVMPSKRRWPP